MLYTAIRIIEGLIFIALQVRPLGSLRVITLHRPMVQRRTCRVVEFFAFLFWLYLILNFFGFVTPLTLVSRFLRFVLEEDVYHHFRLASRHSIRNLKHASLCNPALGIRNRLGSAWH